jgi:hypothetical protein
MCVCVFQDFRKLDSGMFTLTLEPTDLRQLIDSAARQCRALLAPDVELLYRVRPANVVVQMDARRVFQIITNGLR